VRGEDEEGRRRREGGRERHRVRREIGSGRHRDGETHREREEMVSNGTPILSQE